jgi:hypothetical protein
MELPRIFDPEPTRSSILYRQNLGIGTIHELPRSQEDLPIVEFRTPTGDRRS